MNSRKNLDFGKGVYLTASKKQAEKWALKYKNGTVYVFDVDFKDLHIVEYKDEDLDYVLYLCRIDLEDVAKEVIDEFDKADIISGMMLDGTTKKIEKTAEKFNDGDISYEKLKEKIKLFKNKDQICLKTQEALDILNNGLIYKYNVRKDKKFQFAYDMAFKDSTLRNAFVKKSKSDLDFQNRKQYIKENAYCIVKEYIDDIFEGNHPDPIIPIKKIEEKFSDKGFSFGNAQKLVNMTAKYMFLCTYYFEDKSNLFNNCHCPMDGIMIDVIKKRCKSFKHKNVSWSRLKTIEGKIPQVYIDFQNEIKKICLEEESIPIEFDYFYWE